MATLKACVRKQRKDGFFPVYIRIVHNTRPDYIKTDKIVNQKGVDKNGDIKDTYVIRYCSDKIASYVDRLNKVNINHWTVKQVKDYLLSSEEDLCFSDYARLHNERMINEGMGRNAKNYTYAYNSLERYAGTNKVMFSHLTSFFVNAWIDSLKNTKRAKEMYPICIRQIFKAAIREYNDYDSGVIRIKTNPWIKVDIPQADKAEKLAITPEECRLFFSAPIPESKFVHPKMELGRDVAMMVLCLAGINTVDLYNLKKDSYKNGVISYNRAKTAKSRADGAYMEMMVPDIIKPLFEKYMDCTDSPNLLCFYKRHSTSDSFGANVNSGIRQLCESLGISKEDRYCCYTFRHTWGTIAQNNCNASISEVAFGMNHASAHKVTRGYLKIDYTPAWELNKKVIDYVFFGNGNKTTEKEDINNLRVSPKYLIRGGVYFRGNILYQVEDIGYNNKEEVIEELFKMVPDTVPVRSMLQFKIENLDKKQQATYERMKR